MSLKFLGNGLLVIWCAIGCASEASGTPIGDSRVPYSDDPIPCSVYQRHKSKLAEYDAFRKGDPPKAATFFQAKARIGETLVKRFDYMGPQGEEYFQRLVVFEFLEVLEGPKPREPFKIDKRAFFPDKKAGDEFYILGFFNVQAGQNAAVGFVARDYREIRNQPTHWLLRWVWTWFSECDNLP